MVLDCRSTFLSMIKAIKKLLDPSISLGKIINAMQDLRNVKRGAQDELFHQNKPGLAGVDIDSLYCNSSYIYFLLIFYSPYIKISC